MSLLLCLELQCHNGHNRKLPNSDWIRNYTQFAVNEHNEKEEVVIMHWACSKITASLAIPDATLLEILLDKLLLIADKNGRCKLAAMLVEHEPRSSKQVPLLLSIGEEDTALTKATESGDTDLVYLVLFHIWQKVLLLRNLTLYILLQIKSS
ncbi:hypothetical protein F0562_030272 [Nyssa sinensis]|uniref:Vps16 C-terminal domain-containing protein n=1 Tax=Nyssa sinensis TaxID=561372 RepID=A0A5J5AY27_9ASTE|nr:hypothetical protein F0562_030272 [Nyssa sinensis]